MRTRQQDACQERGETFEKSVDDWTAMDRRDFLRMTAAASGAILAGSATVSSFPEDAQATEAAYASDWVQIIIKTGWKG